MSPEPVRVDFRSGDATIAAYRWDAPGEPRAIVQVTHGMGEHARRYDRLAEEPRRGFRRRPGWRTARHRHRARPERKRLRQA